MNIPIGPIFNGLRTALSSYLEGRERKRQDAELEKMRTAAASKPSRPRLMDRPEVDRDK